MSLVLALLLDAALGEPKWLWSRLTHPAILMGRAIAWLDQTANTDPFRRLKGALGLAALSLLALMIGAAIQTLGPFPTALTAAILLAQRSLAQHVDAVARALRRSTQDGRRAVAMIVGRDTAQMDSPAIARAAIESGAENLSDGVIAPAFWFAIGGLPAMMLYKLVNTADSMIGYRTPRHAEFGWAAARLDDLMNWVPARLTALLIMLAKPTPNAWAIATRDARLHRSPNAGWPEAAMAVALDIALSGPRSYEGKMQDFPYVHPKGRHNPGARDVQRVTHVLWRSWALLVVLALAIALL